MCAYTSGSPVAPDDDVAEQRDPPAGSEDVVRTAPADRRIDPVPRRRRDQQVEAAAAIVPPLERRLLDGDAGRTGEPLAGDRRERGARLHRGDGRTEAGQPSGGLTGPAPDLEHRRPTTGTGEAGEVGEQVGRVGGTDAVVQLRHLVEHPAQRAGIGAVHR